LRFKSKISKINNKLKLYNNNSLLFLATRRTRAIGIAKRGETQAKRARKRDSKEAETRAKASGEVE
jgi:hypothetical protein